jgi:hypothetical protein
MTPRSCNRWQPVGEGVETRVEESAVDIPSGSGANRL